MDLLLVGGLYTWSNNWAWSRLDIFCFSLHVRLITQCCSKRRLPGICSDHFPILLDCGGIPAGSSYFKYENMWLKVEGFVEKVKLWRPLYLLEGTPHFILAGKLKPCRRIWRQGMQMSLGILIVKGGCFLRIYRFLTGGRWSLLFFRSLSGKSFITSRLEKVLLMEKNLVKIEIASHLVKRRGQMH